MRHITYAAALLVFCGLAAGQETDNSDWRVLVGPEGASEEIAPIEAPFAMPQLLRPVFPDKTFNIADYGAIGDGASKCTQAIASAIDACAQAGGGVVLVPEGVWLTGAIHLESNVNLHLAEGAILRFSTEPDDYLPVVFTRWAGFECYNYSPLIYARDCENIAITGPGKIDGNGESWWPWFERQAATAERMYRDQILKGVPPGERVYGTVEAGLRPQLISPINCRNVLLEDFTIAKPGPFWTIDLVYCENVIVRELKLFTIGGPNTDGINLDSCTNALVEHCLINAGDDCICVKSGMNEDGWRVARPTQNVVMRYNRIETGHSGVAFGSDMSGDIRNVFVQRSIYDGTDVGVRLKSTRGRGGVVERLWIEDIDMIDIKREAIQMTTAYRAWMATTEGKAPVFHDIEFSNIRVDAAQTAVLIEGLPESPIENVRMRNVTMAAVEGFSAKWTHGIELLDVSIQSSDNAGNR